MNIKNMAWVTDIHLDFLGLEQRVAFYRSIAQTEAEAIVITGDIAVSDNVCRVLEEFSEYSGKNIYFVLGNHDYFYSDVVTVRRQIIEMCNKNKKLHWLGKPEIIELNDDTILVGIDGWADARYGDYGHSSVHLVDSQAIADLYETALQGKAELQQQMQALADADAENLENTLNTAIKDNHRQVIIATHVPPYPESCWHHAEMSDKDWLPFFSSKATGEVIDSFAKKHPHINFLILCGHTHTQCFVKRFENIEIKVGKADFYQPELQEIIVIHCSAV